jgi:hypothetical protein
MSARDLPIYVTRAAPAPTAQWLRRVLAPVAACRFECAPPLEVRPLGEWAGICEFKTFPPDRRVCVSSKVVFWPPENIVSVYLHECCHRLLQSQIGMQHTAEFFCLNAVLLLRSKAAFESDPIFQLDLYDIQDCPPELYSEPNWRGVVLGWALFLAAELAATDASAEAVASTVCERWQQHLQDRERSRIATALQTVVARKTAAAMRQRVSDLQSSRWMWRALTGAGWMSFFSVVYFVF